MIRFCLGVASVAFWPGLPSPLLTLLVLLVIPCIVRWRRVAGCWPLLLGVAWGLGWGQWQLAHRLPPALEQQALAVSAVIEDAPLRDGDRCRFDARVLQWPSSARLYPRRLRLAWYDCPALPVAGQRWHLSVKLKRPHGFRNPAGPDRQLQLLSQGIDATGYVLSAEPEPGDGGLTGRWQRWRGALMAQLAASHPVGGALLNALLTGDRSQLSEAQWQHLRDSGTLHLFVVSGLHIGLLALLSYNLVGVVTRRWPVSRLHRRQWLGVVLALTLSAGYAALAGWALPTQRAWVMMAALLLGWVSWRGASLVARLSLAATLVLLLDPLAVRSPGCWLSFGAAALLLYCAAGGGPRDGRWRSLLRAQWAVLLGLSPWLLLAFQRLPLLSPLLNVVAIPLVTLLLLPLALLALLLFILTGATLPLTGVAALLAGFDQALGWLALPLYWQPGGVTLAAVALATAGSLLLLAPRAMPLRGLGVLLWLPLALPLTSAPANGSFRLTVLDVGQGSAVLVETATHRLLYDTGPRYRSGFVAAKLTLLPYLHSRGIRALDTLLVSHADSDHSGGQALLQQHLRIGRLLGGDSARTGGEPCRAGERWQWDGVGFEVLYPLPDPPPGSNHHSCVLRITAGAHAALLTGDIERSDEIRLLRHYGATALAADWLLAPHHGSRSSSSAPFVAALGAASVVFSNGYRNRFGHPHAEVVQRYSAAGARGYQTAASGALQWQLSPAGVVQRDPWPVASFHYWWD